MFIQNIIVKNTSLLSSRHAIYTAHLCVRNWVNKTGVTIYDLFIEKLPDCIYIALDLTQDHLLPKSILPFIVSLQIIELCE